MLKLGSIIVHCNNTESSAVAFSITSSSVKIMSPLLIKTLLEDHCLYFRSSF